MPDEPMRLKFSVEEYVRLRLIHGVVDVFDELVEYIPLPRALQNPALLPVKFGLPQILALFPTQPRLSQIEQVPPWLEDPLDVLELLWSGKAKAAIDKSILAGARVLEWIADGTQVSVLGSVVLWSPVWHLDP